jgi:hypothetical protein
VRYLVVLAAGVLLLSGCAGDEESAPLLPPGRAIDSDRSLMPTTHLFADPVVARLEIVVDRDQLDPARVTPSVGFDPYEVVGTVATTRRDLGRYTRLRYEYTLRCLTTACIPARLESLLGEQEPGRGERTTIRLAPATVRYEDPSGEFPEVLRTVSWPPVTSVSRLNEAQSDAVFPFRVTPEALPAVSYRAEPIAFAIALLLAALVLLVLPARLGLRWWRRRRAPAADGDPQVVLSPLEQALRLVEWSRGRDAAARRGALEGLAGELERNGGDPTLGGEARALAWARGAPSSDSAGELVRRVREAKRVPA